MKYGGSSSSGNIVEGERKRERERERERERKGKLYRGE